MFARSTEMGITRASDSGTSNKYGSHAFLYHHIDANEGSPAAILLDMEETEILPKSKLPEDALEFFYRISLWCETNKGHKLPINNWKKSVKRLKCIECVKPKLKEKFIVPKIMTQNTLYVPIPYSGRDVLRELRNAFCHNGIIYHDKNDQFVINKNKCVKIAGSISLESIKDFVNVFLSNK